MNKAWSSSTINIIDNSVWLGWTFLRILAIGLCLFQVTLYLNHIMSPELTRGYVFEAITRLLHGLPLYPAPGPEYVPVAHNPFFYLVGAIFYLILGPSAAVLRLTAAVGAVGAWLIVFMAVRRETASVWFGLMAAGLLAAAYVTFDCYFDYANPDSWMLFCALLGFYLLAVKPDIQGNILAITFLCASFWFKQHGGILAVGGVLYLTWRDGWRKSLPYWLQAALLGPLAYFILGPILFGPYFLYYTYEVPSAWTKINLDTFGRYTKYMLRFWLFLSTVTLLAALQLLKQRRRPNVWMFSLPVALLVGLLGSFDAGSENNIYIVPGVWMIITGTIITAHFLQHELKVAKSQNRLLDLLVSLPQFKNILAIGILAASFALNLYNPKLASVYTSPEAWNDYHDLVQRVQALDGAVYMPDVAQFQDSYQLPMPVHWVPLGDLLRGPGGYEANRPLVDSILQDLIRPSKNTYILSSIKLDDYYGHLFGSLSGNYILLEDFNDRYKSLKALPGRYSGAIWPRYLYGHKNNQLNASSQNP